MDHSKQRIWNERYQLASLERLDFVRIGLCSVMIGVAFVMFHYVGNTADIGNKWGRSALIWMWERWQDSSASFSSGDYSHGWLIPLVSAVVIWLKRDEFKKVDKQRSKMGLILIIAALFLHYIGAKAQQTRLSLAAMIGLLWAIPYYFYGWKTARLLLFPCAYLVFALPLNFLDGLTNPLRRLLTHFSVGMANGVGIMVKIDGASVCWPPYDADAYRLEVADTCSGIRSLMAMTALTATYAYFTQRTLLRKWLLFLCSIPLAVAGNMIRITSIIFVAEGLSRDIATTLFHDYAGFITFGISIGLMVGVGALINLDYGAKWKEWKKRLFAPSMS